eukprot:15803970-Heterocapsa_arctica.AAC.1
MSAQRAEDSIGRYNQPGTCTAHANKKNKKVGAKGEDEKARESRRALEGEEEQHEGKYQQGEDEQQEQGGQEEASKNPGLQRRRYNRSQHIGGMVGEDTRY